VIGPAAIITVATPARPARPAGACPLPTEIRIAVVAHQDPLRVVLDIGSVDMEDLRRLSGQEKRHRTLGFYSSTLATKVEPGRVVARADDCELAVRVTGGFRLTERRIHIACEVASLPCLSGMVITHLMHNAVAEGEAFDRLVARVERRLSSATFSAKVRAERGARGRDRVSDEGRRG